MDCQDVRALLLEHQRGRLASDAAGAVRAHLASCPACAAEAAADAALTEVLESRLPQHPASPALKRRLAAEWAAPAAVAPARPRRWRVRAPVLAVAGLALFLLPLAFQRLGGLSDGSRAMVAEAVNDHLRVLDSQHPVDVESGAMHQVKPWFEGRLDFAPVVTFAGDADFPLLGGAVGYFVDRKAAVFVYKRRLHTLTLFVFRAEGLPWPGRGLAPLGAVQAYRAAARGFTVILWQAGELGYALVGDVDPAELDQLAARLAG